MTGIVIDASCVVELVHQHPLGDRVRGAIGAAAVHAPDLITSEVASALARLERAGAATEDIARAVRSFDSMPIVTHPLRELLDDAWLLRRGVRITDAFYVALARSLDAPLLTSDRRLGRVATDQSLCDVLLIE